jgi:hypothetical protein
MFRAPLATTVTKVPMLMSNEPSPDKTMTL